MRVADDPVPAPGSAAERERFLALQSRLSLDQDVLAKVDGVRHYEERMLSMLMLLRLPNTRVVFLTSEPLAPVIVDYYLSLLTGIPAGHSRDRLALLSAHDASPLLLTRKLLDRPRLLARVRAAIGDPQDAHLLVFNATPDEVSLAVALGIPMYACDPALAQWGSKSGSRKAFRRMRTCWCSTRRRPRAAGAMPRSRSTCARAAPPCPTRCCNS